MTHLEGRVVLDASAVLAMIHGEPGADIVASHADGAVLHPINLAEVLTIVWRDAGRAGQDGADVVEDVVRTLTGLGIDVSGAFTERDAVYAARLSAEAPRLGLSLGDRCCLTVAAALPGGRALTSDTAWARLPSSLGITVQLIR